MVIAVSQIETSVTNISFIFLMLATYPDIQYKVYEELHQIYCSDDPKHVPITYNDIKITDRRVTQDIEVREGYTIPKDTSAVFLIYKLHRSAKYWPRPLVFDPDRFLPGKNCSTYLFPFSQNFAMLNMTVNIATLIRRFLIKINNPIGISEIKISLTLKPHEIRAIHYISFETCVMSAIEQNMDYKTSEKCCLRCVYISLY
ncbi:cytochrome P450 4A14-like [Vespa crabro]|uniref:cytochrome P450 4A14-like n=1 Tax=Vespa crabro TaxID=7445 RepID=UPI001F015F8C|nr:cytochrome P450 4A14-like [Vespa crabro]